MGSSSQLYRDAAAASTETNVENATTGATEAVYWHREDRTPEWHEVMSDLRWVWEVHVYGMASLFSVLSVLCLFTVLRLRSQLSARPHLSSLNVFLGILATSRLVVLYVDPYGSKETLPLVILQVFWDLGYPCLVSAFALLQLSFVRETRVKMNRLSDESVVSIIITFHFCLIITSGVLGALQPSLRILWLITQVAFIVWGGFLYLSSLCGCLRLLRSIVKVPPRFLTQVDPGYEINSIMPLGMFTEQPQEEHQKSQNQPRIRITDVNDQTFSYASEGSLSVHPDLQRSEALPLRCILPTSPDRRSSTAMKSKPVAHNEDPAVIKPLIAGRCSIEDDTGKQVPIPTTIPTLQSTTTRQALHHLSPRSIEEFKFDPRKLKRQYRSRLEKQLRQLVVTSFLGVFLCLLKIYDVFGPHSLFSAGIRPTFIYTWFCFETMSRIVEFTMAYAMVCVCQQSIKSRYYYIPN